MATLINIRMDAASEGVADEKERGLMARLAELPSVIVALSGGIDWRIWRGRRIARWDKRRSR